MNAPPSPLRKIVQLAACTADGIPSELYALCDDGSVWRSSFFNGQSGVRVDTSVIAAGVAVALTP